MSFPLGICASSMPVTIRPFQNEVIPFNIGSTGYSGLTFPFMYPDQFQVGFQIKNAGLSGTYDVLIGKTSPPTGSAPSQETTMPSGSNLLSGKGSFFIRGGLYGVSNAAGQFYAAGTTIYYRLKTTINGVDSYTPIYSFVRA